MTTYFNEQQAVEVQWYRINGRFPEHRIAYDANHQPYVIGDASWNQKVPHNMQEHVEHKMPRVSIRSPYRADRPQGKKP